MGLSDFATVKHNESKNVPGPGAYDVKSTLSEPKVTIKGRNEPKAGKLVGTSNDVGPGKYPVASTIGTTGPSYSISGPLSGAARQVSSETTLGPKYSPRNHEMGSSGPKFSIALPAPPKKQLDASPGPVYDLPSTMGKKAVSMAFRHTTDVSNAGTALQSPPADYDIKRFGDPDTLPKPKNIQPHYGYKREVLEVPGPGKYDVVNDDIATKTTPRTVNGRVVPKLPGRNFPPEPKPCGDPGPAAYDIPTDYAKTGRVAKKGVSILNKFEEFDDMDKIYPKPAPGTYDIPTTIGGKNKGFSLGQRLEDPKQKLLVPGPGEYEPKQYSLAAIVTKSDQGVKLNGGRPFDGSVPHSEVRPINHYWRENAIKRLNEKPSTRIPGELEFNPKPVTPRAPAWKMTARLPTNENPDNQVPAPSTYHPEKFTQSQKPRAPNFMRGSFRPGVKDNGVPGPGSYNDADAFSKTKPAKGASMAKKGSGPGQFGHTAN